MPPKFWFTATGLACEHDNAVYHFNYDSEDYKHVLCLMMYLAELHRINVLELLRDAPARVRAMNPSENPDDSVQIIEPDDDSVQIIEPDDDSVQIIEPDDDSVQIIEPDDDSVQIIEPDDDSVQIIEPEDMVGDNFEGLQYGGGRKRKGSPAPVAEKARRLSEEEGIPDAQRLPIDDTPEDIPEPEIEIYKIPYGLTDKLTDEDVDKANKHLEIYGSAKFKRVNIERMSLPILKLRFVNIMDGDKPAYDVIGETLNTFLIAMVARAGGNMETTDLAVGLYHPGLKENRGLWHRRTGEMINGFVLQNLLARIIQSNDQVQIDDALEFELHVFKDINMVGGCIKNCDTNGEKFWFDKKAGARAFIRSDGKCLLKSIIMGRLHYDAHTATPGTQEKKDALSKWKNMLLYQKTKMDDLVKKLEDDFKLPDKDMHSLNDLKFIADADTDWKYCVYIRDHVDPKFRLIATFNEQATKTIRIGFRDAHFDLIRLDSTVVDTMFCTKCLKSHNDACHARNCTALCFNCGRQGCEAGTSNIECTSCKKYFKSDDCFKAHKEKLGRNTTSFCQKYKRCDKCDRLYSFKPRKPHQCGAKYCGKCKEERVNPHNCCYNTASDKQKANLQKKNSTYRIIAYDMETIVKKLENGVLKDVDKHEVNVVCWGAFCNKCLFNDTCDDCPEDGYISYKNVKPGETVQSQFTKMLVENKKFNNSIVIAHNGGRYDHHFVLSEVYAKHYNDIELTAKGRNILGASLAGNNPRFGGEQRNHIQWRDSYNHIPMSIGAMPKAYGIPSLVKGTFPYGFNMPENYGKVLPRLPPLKYYGIESMAPARAEEVRKYHAEHLNDGFDFDKAIHEYCADDVRVLIAALKTYVQKSIETFQGVNPLKASMTTAGFVKYMLQNYHIKDGDIGYIPERGFGGTNQSVIAMKWILWQEKQTGVKLKHKLRGGEEVIGGYGVDAYNETTKEITQFHGCYFHGCKECYNPDEINIFNEPATNGDLFDKTARRTKLLRDLGYTVTEVWEHTVRDELRTNAEMRTFFENCRHAHHLIPRSGMHGGRTQPYTLKSIAGDGEHIRYVDYCSLYPAVNTKVAYPRGQPTVHTDNFPPIDGKKVPYRGIYFCDVLPPVDLKIPVLPYSHSHKLLFPLCRSCAEEGNVRGSCTHTKVSERVVTGTFYSEELNAAIERGYKVLRYHTIYSWDDWVEGGYFADFIKPLLALKHQASGYPDHVKTDAEKDAFIAHLEAVDGVKLNKNEMVKNPALRTVVKTAMNSCWGKFGENPRQTELRLFATSDHEGQRAFRNETGYRLTILKDLDHNVTMMGRQRDEEFLDTKPFANIVIAIITTAMARLWLLEAMERAGAARLIYCDTDSVVFKELDGEDLMGDLIGTGLGKLESEVPDGFEITKFIGVAPKTYAYFMENDNGAKKHVVKAKGISINETSKIKVNLDTYEKLVDEYLLTDDVTPITAAQFNMKKQLFQAIESSETDKKMRPSMAKMHLLADGTTRPFGYMEAPVAIQNDYDFYEPTTIFKQNNSIDCRTNFNQRP